MNMYCKQNKSEGARPVGNEGRFDFRHPVGEREAETRGKELLDVWAADVSSLLDLNDTEDLDKER